jgi:hypothetical protein
MRNVIVGKSRREGDGESDKESVTERKKEGDEEG